MNDISKLNYNELFNYLCKKYNVESNPKRNVCFHYAWDYGHSSGNHEVEYYFSDLINLII